MWLFWNRFCQHAVFEVNHWREVYVVELPILNYVLSHGLYYLWFVSTFFAVVCVWLKITMQMKLFIKGVNHFLHNCTHAFFSICSFQHWKLFENSFESFTEGNEVFFFHSLSHILVCTVYKVFILVKNSSCLVRIDVFPTLSK